MSLMVWMSLLLICVLGAMSPGPSLAVVLRQTVSNGRGHGILAGCSHSLGVGLWAAMTVWGLGLLVNDYEPLYRLITWLGAAYLIWLGINALRLAATPKLLEWLRRHLKRVEQLTGVVLIGLAVRVAMP